MVVTVIPLGEMNGKDCSPKGVLEPLVPDIITQTSAYDAHRTNSVSARRGWRSDCYEDREKHCHQEAGERAVGARCG